ncbi:uncharacterized protein ZBIST_4954 [Zygosaccharomyces bailii]|nr:uncharacterized protein ZBIST_4954 [Zygosaccharomyces bailii]
MVLSKNSMNANEFKRLVELTRGLSSYPTQMFNPIKEKSVVPLGHVHKIWKKIESPPKEALKLLLALFEIEPQSKAMVIASTTNQVEELVCCWREYFRVVLMHERLGLQRYFSCRNVCRVVIGTNSATKGIDIKELRMVIVFDNKIKIIELIHRAGRLRHEGLFYQLSRKNIWMAKTHRGELHR